MIDTQLSIEPISGALGAEIHGVDLSESLSDEIFNEVRQALFDHEVIFFREQDITPDQHKAFASKFGELIVHPFVTPLDGHPEIVPIIKEKEDKANFGGGWHTDVSFMERPALGSVLYALDTPTFGGDTLWASMTKAYEALSDGMKETLSDMRAIHSASSQYGASGESAKNNSKRSGMEVKVSDEAEAQVTHPVIRTNPDSDRKGLYVNEGFTQKFVGWKTHESKPLLRFLFDHCTDERFTCRFRWEKGSLAFWDNRVTQHYALNDYHGQRREMHRVTIEGERPV